MPGSLGKRARRRTCWRGQRRGCPPSERQGWELTPPRQWSHRAREMVFLAQPRHSLATCPCPQRWKPRLLRHPARTSGLAWNWLQHPAGSMWSPRAWRLHQVQDKEHRPAGLTLSP
uniref:Alternative protein MYLK3 n=1 Tax=Homo sapiens TaxID=9606 RepID=L8E9T3_HUMAN|nr:alternative protein MYLK3 [Homo sapiens]